jgi:hypothetical protein
MAEDSSQKVAVWTLTMRPFLTHHSFGSSKWSKRDIEFSYRPSIVTCALIPLIGRWTLRTVGLKKLRMNSRTGQKYKKTRNFNFKTWSRGKNEGRRSWMILLQIFLDPSIARRASKWSRGLMSQNLMAFTFLTAWKIRIAQVYVEQNILKYATV